MSSAWLREVRFSRQVAGGSWGAAFPLNGTTDPWRAAMTINVDKKVVHDRNRVYYWRYRGLTGCERPDYDVAISLSCPRRLRPAEMGNPRQECLEGVDEVHKKP